MPRPLTVLGADPLAIVRRFRYIATRVLILLKAFFEIALLRRGPDSLPDAWLVLYAAIGMWIGGILLMAAIAPGIGVGDLLPIIAGWVSSLLLFAIVIAVAGYPQRIRQSLSAIAGAGAAILLVQVLAASIMLPLNVGTAANLAVQILLLWAVFVKGHIVAMAISVRPILGVGISVIVYIMRELVTYSLSPVPA